MHLDDEPLLNYTSKQIMGDSSNTATCGGLKSTESKNNLVFTFGFHLTYLMSVILKYVLKISSTAETSFYQQSNRRAKERRAATTTKITRRDRTLSTSQPTVT